MESGLYWLANSHGPQPLGPDTNTFAVYRGRNFNRTIVLALRANNGTLEPQSPLTKDSYRILGISLEILTEEDILGTKKGQPPRLKRIKSLDELREKLIFPG